MKLKYQSFCVITTCLIIVVNCSYNGNKVSDIGGAYSLTGDEDDSTKYNKSKMRAEVVEKTQSDYFPENPTIVHPHGPYAEEFMQIYLLGKQLLSNRLWPSPFDISLEIDTVSALLSWIRISTQGNTPIIQHHTYTESNRSIWRNYAPVALNIFRKIKRQLPCNAKASLLQLEALMYEIQGQRVTWANIAGINSLRLRKLIFHCEQYHKTYGGGLVYALQVGFYLNAQWPFRDKHRALKAAVKALRVDPYSRRNRYLYGAVLLSLNQIEDAKKVFQSALDAGCTSDAENDLATFIEEEILKGISACDKIS